MLPEICQILDFRTEDQTPALTRMRTAFFEHFDRQGQDETAIVSARDNGHRQLQFEGDRCKPSVLDVADNIPLLSTFVQLLDAAGLEDIFLCAGEYCNYRACFDCDLLIAHKRYYRHFQVHLLCSRRLTRVSNTWTRNCLKC